MVLYLKTQGGIPPSPVIILDSHGGAIRLVLHPAGERARGQGRTLRKLSKTNFIKVKVENGYVPRLAYLCSLF